MKLPRLQLHLSTLVVSIILAGLLVGLNIVKSSTSKPTLHVTPKAGELGYWVALDQTGWPFTFRREFELHGEIHRYESNSTHLTFNIAICLALLIVATVATEWLTRRMKRGAT